MCLVKPAACFCFKESTSPENQEQGAGSSKSMPKAKNVELPILTCTVRQLDRELLGSLVEEEVSVIYLSQNTKEELQFDFHSWTNSIVKSFKDHCLQLRK